MGERVTPECDIFKTLQPKGLLLLRVTVEQLTATPGKPDTLHTCEVEVGERGKKRVIRIAKNATKPYASTQHGTDGKAAGGA